MFMRTHNSSHRKYVYLLGEYIEIFSHRFKHISHQIHIYIFLYYYRSFFSGSEFTFMIIIESGAKEDGKENESGRE